MTLAGSREGSQRLSSYFDIVTINAGDQLGSSAPGLVPIIPSDSHFTKVLHYRRYRLNDKTRSPHPDITRDYGS